MRSILELLKEEDNAINAIIRIDEREEKFVNDRQRIMDNPHECLMKQNDIERYDSELRALYNSRVAAEQNLTDIRVEIYNRLRAIVYGEEVVSNA